MSHPVAYADRLRIRQPGDAGFALGPHVDSGSCERWEENGYGRGGVYNEIFQGNWETYDPWESSCRLPVVSDLYNGAGGCSVSGTPLIGPWLRRLTFDLGSVCSKDGCQCLVLGRGREH